MTINDPRASASYVRLPEVCRQTGLARSTVYKLAQEGHFPKPYRLGPRTSGWKWGEILDWLESRERAGGERVSA